MQCVNPHLADIYPIADIFALYIPLTYEVNRIELLKSNYKTAFIAFLW